jgi:hypothetical protein
VLSSLYKQWATQAKLKINESVSHEIVIYNSIGKYIKTISGKGNSGTIMTKSLTAGIYFAKLTNADLKHKSSICRFIIIKN